MVVSWYTILLQSVTPSVVSEFYVNITASKKNICICNCKMSDKFVFDHVNVLLSQP